MSVQDRMQHNILPEEIRYKHSRKLAAARLTELSISFERNLKILDGKNKGLYGFKRSCLLAKFSNLDSNYEITSL